MGSVTGKQTSESYTRVGGYGGISALDELSSADIAMRIAQGADLIVANNVKNYAESLDAQVEFTTAGGSYLNKPQIVATDAKTNRDIINYEVQPNDTVASIARKFNVTSDTIIWENDLVGSLVSPGKKLRILPVSVIIYKVLAGDTAERLAKLFKANAAQIIAFNDAELSGLKPGELIIIPNGQQIVSTPVYFSSGYYGFAFGSQALYGGNGYSYGYCTWHVANRRIAIDKPLPTNLGNAVTWPTLAQRGGLPVGTSPKVGAAIWPKNAASLAGGLGHVGFIEKQNSDGSYWVSDMNYFGFAQMDVNSPKTGGWNRVSYRLLLPEDFGDNLYIY